MLFTVVDLETTSVEPTEARVVTAFVGLWNSEEDRFVQYLDFLVNPGVDIPEEASAIHGISTEQASKGMDPVEFLELFHYVAHDWAEYPHVLYNAPYDLSVLNAELERYGYTAFDWNKRHIIDALVLERRFNKYKKGKKRLMDVAEQRGITLDESRLHSADYDAEVTARVAVQQLAEWGLPTNEEQAEWHREWAEDFEKWLRNAKGDASIVIEREWPVRTKSLLGSKTNAAEDAADKEEA